MNLSRLIELSLFVFVVFTIAVTGNSAFGQVDDDHGDNAATATPVGPSSVTPGDIEVEGDTDWFSFLADAGADVTLETELISLPDSVLRLFASDGDTQLAFDDDGGAGLASRIEWTAPADGTYFAAVSAFAQNQTGTYFLSIDGNAIPEPSAISLTLVALPFFGRWRRRSVRPPGH